MKLYKFSKRERIYTYADFQKIIKKGGVFFCYPFRCMYVTSPADKFEMKVALSVSKRNVKLSVDRNRIKRMIREAYRLQKNEILTTHLHLKKEILILLIYIEKKEIPYTILQKQLNILLNRLIKINLKNDVKNIMISNN
jgi:ribonuclease P protein component